MADQLTKVMTVSYPSRMRQIPTACGVVHSYLSGGTSEVTEFKALWDTGADGSVVSNSVVAALGFVFCRVIPYCSTVWFLLKCAVVVLMYVTAMWFFGVNREEKQFFTSSVRRIIKRKD